MPQTPPHCRLTHHTTSPHSFPVVQHLCIPTEGPPEIRLTCPKCFILKPKMAAVAVPEEGGSVGGKHLLYVWLFLGIGGQDLEKIPRGTLANDQARCLFRHATLEDAPVGGDSLGSYRVLSGGFFGGETWTIQGKVASVPSP